MAEEKLAKAYSSEKREKGQFQKLIIKVLGREIINKFKFLSKSKKLNRLCEQRLKSGEIK